jgi:hypothetical protein
VLVEDAHWSEDPLLNLLERLARDVEAPLLLIVTGRPELVDRRPGWGVAGTTVQLEALTPDDSLRMLSGNWRSSRRDSRYRTPSMPRWPPG